MQNGKKSYLQTAVLYGFAGFFLGDCRTSAGGGEVKIARRGEISPEPPSILRLAGEARPFIAGDLGAGLVGVLKGDLMSSFVGDLKLCFPGVLNILLFAGESTLTTGLTGDEFFGCDENACESFLGELNNARFSLRGDPRPALWTPLLGQLDGAT